MLAFMTSLGQPSARSALQGRREEEGRSEVRSNREPGWGRVFRKGFSIMGDRAVSMELGEFWNKCVVSAED